MQKITLIHIATKVVVKNHSNILPKSKHNLFLNLIGIFGDLIQSGGFFTLKDIKDF